MPLSSHAITCFIQRPSEDGRMLTLGPSGEKVLQAGDRLIIFLPPAEVEELERRLEG
jgi:Trk K+ transport system NAD-binding subunit